MLALAACSSGTSSSASAGSTQASGSQASSAPAATNVSGGAIKVGFIEPVSGAVTYPTETPALKGAQQYLSTHGGVDGHPLQLVICDSDGTPATATNCANNFVQQHVVMVLDGYDPTDGEQLPILARAGIPMIGVVAYSGVADTNSDAFFFGPASQAFGVGPLQLLHEQGINDIAFALADIPADHTYYNLSLAPVAKKLGMTVSMTYYPSTSPNWTVLAATLESTNPQVAGLVAAPEADCTSMFKALRASGYTKPVFLGGCSSFIQAVGPSQATGTFSYTALWQPDMQKYAPPVIQSQLALYGQAMNAIGQGQIGDQHGVAAFASVMDAAEILKMVKGTPTASSALQAIKSLRNWQPFLDPPATCNHEEWPGTSACTNTILVTKVAADGQFQPAVGNGFQSLNPGL